MVNTQKKECLKTLLVVNTDYNFVLSYCSARWEYYYTIVNQLRKKADIHPTSENRDVK